MLISEKQHLVMGKVDFDFMNVTDFYFKSQSIMSVFQIFSRQ